MYALLTMSVQSCHLADFVVVQDQLSQYCSKQAAAETRVHLTTSGTNTHV